MDQLSYKWCCSPNTSSLTAHSGFFCWKRVGIGSQIFPKLMFVCLVFFPHFWDIFKSLVLLVLFLRVNVSHFYHRGLLICAPRDLVFKVKSYRSNRWVWNKKNRLWASDWLGKMNSGTRSLVYRFLKMKGGGQITS